VKDQLQRSWKRYGKKVKRIPGVDGKGYPVIKAGPLRDVRIHRLIAEAMIGRPLRKDEDVHHKDGNKLNCHPSNLQVLGHNEHGSVSAKQHWYLKAHDIVLEQEFNAYMNAEDGGGY
jgi:hypothetical protein